MYNDNNKVFLEKKVGHGKLFYSHALKKPLTFILSNK
jgi:hypothetical protein